MKILLLKEDKKLLTAEGIGFDQEREFTEQEAFELLEQIYDVEIKYSNFPRDDMKASEKAARFAHIADMIQNQIPEN